MPISNGGYFSLDEEAIMRRIQGANLSTKFRELGFPFARVRNTGLVGAACESVYGVRNADDCLALAESDKPAV
jgi:hypothetical protein